MGTNWQRDIRQHTEKECLARKILGVAGEADALVIKKAFWLLAMQYHPDKCPRDEEARRRFSNIVNAYEFLVKGRGEGRLPATEDAPDEGGIGKYLSSESLHSMQ